MIHNLAIARLRRQRRNAARRPSYSAGGADYQRDKKSPHGLRAQFDKAFSPIIDVQSTVKQINRRGCAILYKFLRDDVSATVEAGCRIALRRRPVAQMADVLHMGS